MKLSDQTPAQLVRNLRKAETERDIHARRNELRDVRRLEEYADEIRAEIESRKGA